ncbi:MAG: VOC family protein [Myxococcaceae bacterium]
MPIKAIPQGYEGVTPYLCIRGATEAIEFYKKAFAATETGRLMQPDGRVGHADLKIGACHIMLADEFPELGFKSPKSLGGVPLQLHLYVEDVDNWIARAIANGATLTRPVTNAFYGDRIGSVTDPFGFVWSIASHIEDVSPEEMARRASLQHG